MMFGLWFSLKVHGLQIGAPIGTGGFNTDAGGVVKAGAGASGAAARAGGGAATGTDFGIGSKVSHGGFIRAVRAGVVHGASE